MTANKFRCPRHRRLSYRGVENSSCLPDEQLITIQWHRSTSQNAGASPRQADTSAFGRQLLVSSSSRISNRR